MLRQVEQDDAYANIAMPGILSSAGLSGRDAAFATELAYGTLRWQALYDAVLNACITGDPSRVEPAMRRILRLGTHQLLGMRVPAHAAVDSSCALARAEPPAPSAAARAGFVNGVLRSVAGRDRETWVAHLGIQSDQPADLAIRWSHPTWIVRAFADALGSRRSELADLLAADNEPVRPALVARPGRITAEQLRALPGVDAARWSPLGGILSAGAPEAIAEVRAGDVGVQDEGSQLVALALAAAEVTSGTGQWLDACAGPGGKAALLAGLAAQHQASLVAVEPHAHRAALVRSALRPWPASRVIAGDARTQPWGDQRFDRVLVDAPCTGIGALRRRPEARWRRTSADLATLGPLQRDLLRSAIAATAVGGVIGYATCSPHLAETEAVVSDVAKADPRVRIEDAHALLPDVPDCGSGPFVQLWPHRHGTDGMFLAILRRCS